MSENHIRSQQACTAPVSKSQAYIMPHQKPTIAKTTLVLAAEQRKFEQLQKRYDVLMEECSRWRTSYKSVYSDFEQLHQEYRHIKEENNTFRALLHNLPQHVDLSAIEILWNYRQPSHMYQTNVYREQYDSAHRQVVLADHYQRGIPDVVQAPYTGHHSCASDMTTGSHQLGVSPGSGNPLGRQLPAHHSVAPPPPLPPPPSTGAGLERSQHVGSGAVIHGHRGPLDRQQLGVALGNNFYNFPNNMAGQSHSGNIQSKTVSAHSSRDQNLNTQNNDLLLLSPDISQSIGPISNCHNYDGRGLYDQLSNQNMMQSPRQSGGPGGQQAILDGGMDLVTHRANDLATTLNSGVRQVQNDVRSVQCQIASQPVQCSMLSMDHDLLPNDMLSLPQDAQQADLQHETLMKRSIQRDMQLIQCELQQLMGQNESRGSNRLLWVENTGAAQPEVNANFRHDERWKQYTSAASGNHYGQVVDSAVNSRHNNPSTVAAASSSKSSSKSSELPSQNSQWPSSSNLLLQQRCQVPLVRPLVSNTVQACSPVIPPNVFSSGNKNQLPSLSSSVTSPPEQLSPAVNQQNVTCSSQSSVITAAVLPNEYDGQRRQISAVGPWLEGLDDQLQNHQNTGKVQQPPNKHSNFGVAENARIMQSNQADFMHTGYNMIESEISSGNGMQHHHKGISRDHVQSFACVGDQLNFEKTMPCFSNEALESSNENPLSVRNVTENVAMARCLPVRPRAVSSRVQMQQQCSSSSSFIGQQNSSEIHQNWETTNHSERGRHPANMCDTSVKPGYHVPSGPEGNMQSSSQLGGAQVMSVTEIAWQNTSMAMPTPRKSQSSPVANDLLTFCNRFNSPKQSQEYLRPAVSLPFRKQFNEQSATRGALIRPRLHDFSSTHQRPSAHGPRLNLQGQKTPYKRSCEIAPPCVRPIVDESQLQGVPVCGNDNQLSQRVNKKSTSVTPNIAANESSFQSNFINYISSKVSVAEDVSPTTTPENSIDQARNCDGGRMDILAQATAMLFSDNDDDVADEEYALQFSNMVSNLPEGHPPIDGSLESIGVSVSFLSSVGDAPSVVHTGVQQQDTSAITGCFDLSRQLQVDAARLESFSSACGSQHTPPSTMNVLSLPYSVDTVTNSSVDIQINGRVGDGQITMNCLPQAQLFAASGSIDCVSSNGDMNSEPRHVDEQMKDVDLENSTCQEYVTEAKVVEKVLGANSNEKSPSNGALQSDVVVFTENDLLAMVDRVETMPATNNSRQTHKRSSNGRTVMSKKRRIVSSLSKDEIAMENKDHESHDNVKNMTCDLNGHDCQTEYAGVEQGFNLPEPMLNECSQYLSRQLDMGAVDSVGYPQDPCQLSTGDRGKINELRDEIKLGVEDIDNADETRLWRLTSSASEVNTAASGQEAKETDGVSMNHDVSSDVAIHIAGGLSGNKPIIAFDPCDNASEGKPPADHIEVLDVADAVKPVVDYLSTESLQTASCVDDGRPASCDAVCNENEKCERVDVDQDQSVKEPGLCSASDSDITAIVDASAAGGESMFEVKQPVDPFACPVTVDKSVIIDECSLPSTGETCSSAANQMMNDVEANGDCAKGQLHLNTDLECQDPASEVDLQMDMIQNKNSLSTVEAKPYVSNGSSVAPAKDHFLADTLVALISSETDELNSSTNSSDSRHVSSFQKIESNEKDHSFNVKSMLPCSPSSQDGDEYCALEDGVVGYNEMHENSNNILMDEVSRTFDDIVKTTMTDSASLIVGRDVPSLVRETTLDEYFEGSRDNCHSSNVSRDGVSGAVNETPCKSSGDAVDKPVGNNVGIVVVDDPNKQCYQVAKNVDCGGKLSGKGVGMCNKDKVDQTSQLSPEEFCGHRIRLKIRCLPSGQLYSALSTDVLEKNIVDSPQRSRNESVTNSKASSICKSSSHETAGSSPSLVHGQGHRLNKRKTKSKSHLVEKMPKLDRTIEDTCKEASRSVSNKVQSDDGVVPSKTKVVATGKCHSVMIPANSSQLDAVKESAPVTRKDEKPLKACHKQHDKNGGTRNCFDFLFGLTSSQTEQSLLRSMPVPCVRLEQLPVSLQSRTTIRLSDTLLQNETAENGTRLPEKTPPEETNVKAKTVELSFNANVIADETQASGTELQHEGTGCHVIPSNSLDSGSNSLTACKSIEFETQPDGSILLESETVTRGICGDYEPPALDKNSPIASPMDVTRFESGAVSTDSRQHFEAMFSLADTSLESETAQVKVGSQESMPETRKTTACVETSSTLCELATDCRLNSESLQSNSSVHEAKPDDNVSLQAVVDLATSIGHREAVAELSDSPLNASLEVQTAAVTISIKEISRVPDVSIKPVASDIHASCELASTAAAAAAVEVVNPNTNTCLQLDVKGHSDDVEQKVPVAETGMGCEVSVGVCSAFDDSISSVEGIPSVDGYGDSSVSHSLISVSDGETKLDDVVDTVNFAEIQFVESDESIFHSFTNENSPVRSEVCSTMLENRNEILMQNSSCLSANNVPFSLIAESGSQCLLSDEQKASYSQNEGDFETELSQPENVTATSSSEVLIRPVLADSDQPESESLLEVADSGNSGMTCSGTVTEDASSCVIAGNNNSLRPPSSPVVVETDKMEAAVGLIEDLGQSEATLYPEMVANVSADDMSDSVVTEFKEKTETASFQPNSTKTENAGSAEDDDPGYKLTGNVDGGVSNEKFDPCAAGEAETNRVEIAVVDDTCESPVSFYTATRCQRDIVTSETNSLTGMYFQVSPQSVPPPVSDAKESCLTTSVVKWHDCTLDSVTEQADSALCSPTAETKCADDASLLSQNSPMAEDGSSERGVEFISPDAVAELKAKCEIIAGCSLQNEGKRVENDCSAVADISAVHGESTRRQQQVSTEMAPDVQSPEEKEFCGRNSPVTVNSQCNSPSQLLRVEMKSTPSHLERQTFGRRSVLDAPILSLSSTEQSESRTDTGHCQPARDDCSKPCSPLTVTATTPRRSQDCVDRSPPRLSLADVYQYENDYNAYQYESAFSPLEVRINLASGFCQENFEQCGDLEDMPLLTSADNDTVTASRRNSSDSSDCYPILDCVLDERNDSGSNILSSERDYVEGKAAAQEKCVSDLRHVQNYSTEQPEKASLHQSSSHQQDRHCNLVSADSSQLVIDPSREFYNVLKGVDDKHGASVDGASGNNQPCISGGENAVSVDNVNLMKPTTVRRVGVEHNQVEFSKDDEANKAGYLDTYIGKASTISCVKDSVIEDGVVQELDTDCERQMLPACCIPGDSSNTSEALPSESNSTSGNIKVTVRCHLDKVLTSKMKTSAAAAATGRQCCVVELCALDCRNRMTTFKPDSCHRYHNHHHHTSSTN